MKHLKKIAGFLGFLLKKTYKHQDDTFSNWKYAYFFFYQRILLFNFHVPWPVHPSSYITCYQNIRFGKLCSPGSNPSQYIQGENGIIMGHNVQLAPGVQLISANHAPENYHKHLKSPPLTIGNNVWVGANAVLLPGITVGDNVIIGAGSIVTKNIPSNSIAVGNPCKVIRDKEPYSKT
jgi:acetyltransferase-like isoleucine patch superfamily enzyme